MSPLPDRRRCRTSSSIACLQKKKNKYQSVITQSIYIHCYACAAKLYRRRRSFNILKFPQRLLPLKDTPINTNITRHIILYVSRIPGEQIPFRSTSKCTATNITIYYNIYLQQCGGADSGVYCKDFVLVLQRPPIRRETVTVMRV